MFNFFASNRSNDKLDRLDTAQQDFARLTEQVDALRSELDGISAAVDAKNVIIAAQEKELTKVKEQLIRKKEEIEHLNDVLRANKPMIDHSTKLLNYNYYLEYISPFINDTYYILTITIPDYQEKFDRYTKQLIARQLREFTAESTMKAISWANDTFKIFMHVEAAKSERIRDSILELLDGSVKEREMILTFRQYRSDLLPPDN